MHDSGVLKEMDKALMFLVQKSTSGAVDGARNGSSRPTHSVSIELLDEITGKLADESGKTAGVGEPGDLVSHKRPREDVEQQGPSLGRALAKKLTILGNPGLLSPIPEP